MIPSYCKCGFPLPHAEVLPIVCSCGRRYGESQTTPPPEIRIGSKIQRMLGCGCGLPWGEWNEKGSEWVAENRGQVAERMKRAGVSMESALRIISIAVGETSPARTTPTKAAIEPSTKGRLAD